MLHKNKFIQVVAVILIKQWIILFAKIIYTSTKKKYNN